MRYFIEFLYGNYVDVFSSDFSYLHMFNEFIRYNSDRSNEILCERIKAHLTASVTRIAFDEKKILSFIKMAKKRWKGSRRGYEKFVRKNEEWLRENLKLNAGIPQGNAPPTKQEKDFSSLSDSQKRRRTEGF